MSNNNNKEYANCIYRAECNVSLYNCDECEDYVESDLDDKCNPENTNNTYFWRNVKTDKDEFYEQWKDYAGDYTDGNW